MQGPLKASLIVAPSAEGKDLSNALRGFIGFGVCATLNSPLYPGNEKLRVLYSLPPFPEKQHSS